MLLRLNRYNVPFVYDLSIDPGKTELTFILNPELRDTFVEKMSQIDVKGYRDPLNTLTYILPSEKQWGAKGGITWSGRDRFSH